MKLIRCDFCQKEGSDVGTMGWFIVDKDFYLIQEIYPKHFCSVKCITDYYWEVFSAQEKKKSESSESS
jgi:hypothetical protein